MRLQAELEKCAKKKALKAVNFYRGLQGTFGGEPRVETVFDEACMVDECDNGCWVKIKIGSKKTIDSTEFGEVSGCHLRQ